MTFTYPGGTEPAVAGLNLHIRSGELIALVGENGAGKSTLIRLLLRFYDPDQGSVRVGGVDLRDLDPAVLRSRIGVLFQDYASYELSVRENVVMGRPDGEVKDERVMEALRDARSDWLLKKMPRGLDSKVGRLFEGGHDLSGGEWQRLALARIMYRDADIWILDEPTSSLDPEAEAAIFAELKENLKGRIGIVISHRFSTVRIADRIAVIADGHGPNWARTRNCCRPKGATRSSSSCRRPGIAESLGSASARILRMAVVVASMELSDEHFLAAFNSCTLPPSLFRHGDHLRLAWLLLHSRPFDEALALIREGLQRFAAHHGASQIYHETLTIAWVKLLATHQEKSFDEFLGNNGHRLNTGLLHRFWTPAALGSEAARSGWVPPDKEALPI